MADENNLRKPGEGGSQAEVKPQDQDAGKGGERSEKRYEDLTQKLKEQDQKHNAELQSRDERIANLEFDNQFKDVVHEYPHATEVKDKIRERVRSGMSMKDASVVVLNEEGKLLTRDQVHKDESGDRSLGGSSDFQPPRGGKRVDEMTQEEMRSELLRLEAKGEISYKPD